MRPPDNSKRSMDAIVTDVHLRSAVAGVRALAAKRRVMAVGPTWSAPGLWSRRVAARAVAPDLLEDRAGFAAAVAGHAREHGPLVVYPGWEGAVDAILDASPPMPPEVIWPYASRAALDLVRDKRRLASLAENAGLRAPRTLLEGTAGELVGSPLPHRCIVKAAEPGGAVEQTDCVESEDELRALLRRLPREQPLLLQERLEGPLTALALVLARDGTAVARFQQRARRTWPLGAGPSSLAVSVAPDEDLVARAAGMLAGVGYWGLAQLQFIDDPEGPALIDVNVRFYGSLPLALACGVDLPGAWHAVTVGDALPAPGPYREGVTYRWLEADISAALQGQPSSDALLRRSPKPRVGAMWSLDDPIPSVLLGGRAVTDRVRRRIVAPARRRLIRDRARSPRSVPAREGPGPDG